MCNECKCTVVGTFCGIAFLWDWNGIWPFPVLFAFAEFSNFAGILSAAMVHVIRLASFLWLWFQCFCPLTPSGNTYRLKWVSLTLDVGYLLSAAAPDLGHGVSRLGYSSATPPPLCLNCWSKRADAQLTGAALGKNATDYIVLKSWVVFMYNTFDFVACLWPNSRLLKLFLRVLSSFITAFEGENLITSLCHAGRQKLFFIR